MRIVTDCSRSRAAVSIVIGSHLKVYLNGKQSVLPMHNADLKTGTLEGIKKQLGLK